VTGYDDLLARVRAFAAAHTPALAAGRAVLAVSGGADSIAAAALLCDAGVIAPALSVVGHFDHRLRAPEDASRDRAAVDALCDRYGLALQTAAWGDPCPGEAAARDARYRFLTGVARRHNIDAIVTGHTSDDQVETVIMHALRGSGLHGLRGMAPQRPIDGALALARPMLCLSRAETRDFCAARPLAFNDDITNGDRSFLRNRVRHGLLPRMEAAAPGARDAILRLAGEARESVAALESVAAAALGPMPAEGCPPNVTLSRAKLNALPPAVVACAWRLAVEHLLGDAREFDRRHYDLLKRAARAVTGSTFELPRGVRLTADAGALVLSLGPLGEAPISGDAAYKPPFEGVLGGWRLCLMPLPRAALAHDRATCVALPAGAVVRGRRPGDRIQPRGMRGHKKLQDYYVDRKIPRRHRDAAPLIARGRDVLWTPFGAAAPVPDGVPFRIEAERVSDPPAALRS
jgi:tRNA(Ile)-lysidine synthase